MDRPLSSQEIFQLSTVEGGLRPDTVSFRTLTMQSDRFVCVRDVQPNGQTSLAVADLANKTSERHDIKDAEAAIMSPTSKVLALRSGNNLQVWNLEAQHRIASYAVPANDTVAFWKWINSTTIAVVSNTAVFHWNIEAGDPVKMFDRAAELDSSVQVLNYVPDSFNKWMMLSGVAKAADGHLQGKTQIYSVDNNASHFLDGHAGCFVTIPTPGDTRPTNLMCLASNSAAGGQVLIMELPTPAKPKPSFEKKTPSLRFTIPEDFPVALHVSPSHKLLTIVSSRGQAFLIDVLTGQLIDQMIPAGSVVFTGCAYEKTGGLVCVSAQGTVFHVSIDDAVIAARDPENALCVASPDGDLSETLPADEKSGRGGVL